MYFFEILVYNNIKAALPKISRYLKNTYFVSRLQLDLVFNAEKRRIEKDRKLSDNCKSYKESLSEDDLEERGLLISPISLKKSVKKV